MKSVPLVPGGLATLVTNASKLSSRTREGFLARSPSSAAAPVRHISAYLDRIEEASLAFSTERVLELEELLNVFKKRHDERSLQLEASRKFLLSWRRT
jgi:hypothetical protein